MLAVFNEVARASGTLCPVDRTPSRGEFAMMAQAMKHPAFNRDLAAWRRSCEWAAQDPLFSGKLRGRPATFGQLATYNVIDRWAADERQAELDRYAVTYQPAPSPLVASVNDDFDSRLDPKWRAAMAEYIEDMVQGDDGLRPVDRRTEEEQAAIDADRMRRHLGDET